MPRLVTLFGIVMLVRPEQLKNACSPMLVTLFGIVMSVRFVQFRNAELPMLVTSLGMTLLLQPNIKDLSDF